MRRILSVDDEGITIKVWWVDRANTYNDELHYTIYRKVDGKWTEQSTVKVAP